MDTAWVWVSATSWARRVMAASGALTASTAIMAGVLLAAIVGLAVDGRVVTGAPAWLKPAKFAASILIYQLTIAWLIASIGPPSRLATASAGAIAAAMVVEMGIIALQAARGTSSHFNASTPLDRALFATMGAFIGVLVLGSVGVAAALFAARFDDRAWGWSLRLGMVLSILGALAGGLMLRANPAQARELASGRTPTSFGGHAVGGPEGGPGLPLTGWSTAHGDLRVPHFVGLHLVQILPLLAWPLLRLMADRSEPARLALVVALAASLVALVGLLAAQALAGRPVVAADRATLAAGGAWLVLSVATVAAIAGPAGAPRRSPVALGALGR